MFGQGRRPLIAALLTLQLFRVLLGFPVLLLATLVETVVLLSGHVCSVGYASTNNSD
jgi:hypothetical protein